MKALSLLEKWYSAQCDGDWEHQYGVSIGTLDNPGWTLEIDLRGTDSEDRTLSASRSKERKTIGFTIGWIRRNSVPAWDPRI